MSPSKPPPSRTHLPTLPTNSPSPLQTTPLGPAPQTIDQTVQKNLRQLRADCDRVIARIAEAEATDAANKEANAARTLQGLGLTAAAVAAAALLITLVLVRAAGSLCGGAPNVFGGGGGAVCESATAQHLAPRDAWVEPVFVPAAAACAALALLLLAAARALWRHAPVLSKREQRRLDEFREVARAVSRANEALYEVGGARAAAGRGRGARLWQGDRGSDGGSSGGGGERRWGPRGGVCGGGLGVVWAPMTRKRNPCVRNIIVSNLRAHRPRPSRLRRPTLPPSRSARSDDPLPRGAPAREVVRRAGRASAL